MNRSIIVLVRRFLLATVIVITLNGCVETFPTITTTPYITTTLSPYKHYAPPKTSGIYLEFDFPRSWIFSAGRYWDTDLFMIVMDDPRSLTIATRSPGDTHGIPSDYGSVVVWIKPVKDDETLDTFVNAFRRTIEELKYTPVSDYVTIIDGYDAVVLEYQVDEPESYSSLMFARRTYFIVNNQLYEIFFSVAEKERDGEFEQGFEYFFNSLRIAP